MLRFSVSVGSWLAFLCACKFQNIFRKSKLECFYFWLSFILIERKLLSIGNAEALLNCKCIVVPVFFAQCKRQKEILVVILHFASSEFFYLHFWKEIVISDQNFSKKAIIVIRQSFTSNFRIWHC